MCELKAKQDTWGWNGVSETERGQTGWHEIAQITGAL